MLHLFTNITHTWYVDLDECTVRDAIDWRTCGLSSKNMSPQRAKADIHSLSVYDSQGMYTNNVSSVVFDRYG